MEDHIVEYLHEQCQPEAMILHGSRASGRATMHSDWDLVLLCDKKHEGVKTCMFEDQALDLRIISSPADIHTLSEKYIPALAKGRILYDSSKALGEALVKSAQELSLKGPGLFTDAHYDVQKMYMMRTLGRFRDNVHNPVVFTYRFGIFYERMFRFWFEHREEWSMSVHDAVSYISEKDPLMWQLIMDITEETSLERKTHIAENIVRHLFQK